eukprot:TRINITY_DN8287_c0_g1_i2.p2 TRINITY_DN8287_c0_g1~~TRINITY_DN8287_c0_g1_i2.p2  ORF type:complete len:152 (-),score=43.65 TRINITY_DN8287_c0_g1_i2:43-498(-)
MCIRDRDNTTVTQRCFLLLKPLSTSKTLKSFVIKIASSNKRATQKSSSLLVEIGDVNVEFFDKIMEELCKLLVGYRELYCLRDVKPIEKLKENILELDQEAEVNLSLIHISEPTRPLYISYAVFCLKKKKKNTKNKKIVIYIQRKYNASNN